MRIDKRTKYESIALKTEVSVICKKNQEISDPAPAEVSHDNGVDTTNLKKNRDLQRIKCAPYLSLLTSGKYSDHSSSA